MYFHRHSSKTGISENVMEDPGQKEAIYAFVKENDVIDEMKGFQDPRFGGFAEKQKKFLANQKPPLPITPRYF